MSSLSNSGSPTQFRGRSLQVEIFNNPVGGVFTEDIKLDDTWKTVKKETCEAGRIANSVCLKLLRGDVNYNLVLEKVLENIIYLLGSKIGGITAISENPDSSILMCLALGKNSKSSIGTMFGPERGDQCSFDGNIFSHDNENTPPQEGKGGFLSNGCSPANETVIISNDVKNDPRTKKNPVNNPEIHKFISIPLEYQNTIIGLLSIANSDEDYTLSSIYSVVPLIDLCSNLLIKSLDAKEPLVSRIQSISKADESKDKFLATMSHEIRTPLNGITGMITLFPGAGPLNTKQKEYIKNLTECTVKLTSLLNNLLDFNKMSSDRLSLKKQPFFIQDAVSDAEKMVSGNVLTKELNFQIIFPKNIHIPKMVGDRQRLVQVLSNLLSNSVKFTDKGSIILTINSEIINKRKSSRSAKWKITFCIQDTGISIPPEEQDKIFNVFFQSSNLTSFLMCSGTGLGLAISQEIARLMGGKITVESDGVPGNGSAFTFYIILDEEINISSLQKEHVDLFTDARILIVDDRPEIRLQLTDILFSWKCIPLAVSSADEALQYLQHGMEFKTALIDINMPQMSGVELAQEIKGKYPELPLIGISSVDIKGGEHYFDFYMYKPVDQNILFPALLECMSRSRKKLDKLSPKKNKKKSKKKLKILVAEDDNYNIFTIKEMLISLGYRNENITITENGLECAREVEKHQGEYDVILMDVVMPVMNGIESSKRIKRLKDAPIIIIVTAGVQPSDKDKCQGIGIDGYLAKPIMIDKLESVLCPLIKNKSDIKKKKTHSHHK